MRRAGGWMPRPSWIGSPRVWSACLPGGLARGKRRDQAAGDETLPRR
ncbi:MAG: hypothetical protein ACLU37_07160 [Collinsella sp.]